MSYTPIILKSPTDLEAIRAAARMNSTRLSDAMILSWAYLPSVEARLAKQIPTYAGLSGLDSVLLKSAAVKMVAAAAIRTIPDSETSLDYSYSQKAEEAAKALEEQAAIDLADITVVSAALDDFDIAAVEGPTRQRKAGTDWIDAGTVIR